MMELLSRRKLITLLSSIPVLGFLGVGKAEANEVWVDGHGWVPYETPAFKRILEGWDTKAKVKDFVRLSLIPLDPEDGKIVVLQYNQSQTRWEQLERDPDTVYGNYVGSARSTIDGKEHQKEVMEVWCPTDKSHITEVVT